MSIGDNVQSPAVLVSQQQEPTPEERAAAGDVQMQQQMVEAFCRESRMKPEWSKKCLIDQNWNYEVCFNMFFFFSFQFQNRMDTLKISTNVGKLIC